MGEGDFESSHHTVKSPPHLSLEGLDSSLKKTLIFSCLQITTLLFQILNLHVLKWRKTDKLLFLINRCESRLSDTQGGKNTQKKKAATPQKISTASVKTACVKTDLAFIQIATFGGAQWCYRL